MENLFSVLQIQVQKLAYGWVIQGIFSRLLVILVNYLSYVSIINENLRLGFTLKVSIVQFAHSWIKLFSRIYVY